MPFDAGARRIAAGPRIDPKPDDNRAPGMVWMRGWGVKAVGERSGPAWPDGVFHVKQRSAGRDLGCFT
ncbi:MAG: hypothetical protein ACYS9X_25280, partial [Planctomycetota bacterium]